MGLSIEYLCGLAPMERGKVVNRTDKNPFSEAPSLDYETRKCESTEYRLRHEGRQTLEGLSELVSARLSLDT